MRGRWSAAFAGEGPGQEPGSGYGSGGNSGSFHLGADFLFLLAEGAGFGKRVVLIEGAGLEGHLENFCDVQGSPVRVLGDLFTAAETVGDDQPVVGGLPDGREKFEFSDGLRDFEVLVMKAERSRHAAASRSGSGEVDAEAAEKRFLGAHLHDRFVMAMSVKQSFARKLR